MDWIGVMETARARRVWCFDGDHASARVDLDPGQPLPGVLDGWNMGCAPLIRAGGDVAPRPLPGAPLVPPFPVGEMQAARAQALELPGLAQARPRVERIGAEVVEVAGLIALDPGFDGVAVLTDDGPARWIHISVGEVISMASSAAATLAACAAPDMDAVEAARARPEALVLALASDDPGTRAGAALGAELAATRALWLGQRVAIRGDGPWAAGLATALGAQGALPDRAPRAPLAPAGFVAAAKQAGIIAA